MDFMDIRRGIQDSTEQALGKGGSQEKTCQQEKEAQTLNNPRESMPNTSSLALHFIYAILYIIPCKIHILP